MRRRGSPTGSKAGPGLDRVARGPDPSPRRSRRVAACRVALAGWVLVAATARGAADTIVGTVLDEIRINVLDPNDPTKCKEVVLGEFAGRLGTDPIQMTMVAGFRKTYGGTLCCDSIHFLNVVLSDPNPPAWKDEAGVKRQIGAGEVYIDPLSGGNIPPGKDQPVPVADRLPFFDGERFDKKASTTGDFINGEKKEYDLDHDVPPSGDWPWNDDPTLDNTFADAPTLTKGLEFATILVCVDDKTLTPLGGIPWGYDANGKAHIDDVFQGSSYPGGLTNVMLDAALKRSGFGDYQMTGDSACCVPEPGSVVLLGSGLLALAGYAVGNRVGSR